MLTFSQCTKARQSRMGFDLLDDWFRCTDLAFLNLYIRRTLHRTLFHAIFLVDNLESTTALPLVEPPSADSSG